MIELGTGAVNMVHKKVGMGSSYLTPYPPSKTFRTLCSVADFQSLLEAYKKLIQAMSVFTHHKYQ